MRVTKNIAAYVRKLGINTSELARKINAPYTAIYRSVGLENPTRELRADEMVAICQLLGVNPMQFDTEQDERNSA